MTKTKVLLVALLALCLAVPAVNASLNVGNIPQTAQINATLTMSQTVNYGDYPSLSVFDGSSYWACSQSDYNRLHQPVTGSYTITSLWHVVGAWQNGPIVDSYNYNIIVGAEPTPEPTPVPSPYISVTELYSDNLGTVYRLQCLPDVDTIYYSAIVPYLIPAYQAGQYAEELRSSDTVVEYRVPAGGTSVFSSVYATYPLTLGVISTTITAPPLTPEQNNTFNPIPDQSQKPLTPFTSGQWQPAITSGQIDVISKSPYLALLANLSDSVQLPVMESPQSVRDRLVPPELENITGPLYDLVDGWADFTNWVPRTIADTVVTLYTPFTSALADCKTVLLSMTAQLAELMKPLYVITPVMYLLIPDFVWIGLCMVLVLLILHALAVFIFGYDVTYYYMGRDTIVADSVPEFPALEK